MHPDSILAHYCRTGRQSAAEDPSLASPASAEEARRKYGAGPRCQDGSLRAAGVCTLRQVRWESLGEDW
jgi:hypothetical protein